MNKKSLGTTLIVVILAVLAFFAYSFRTREVPVPQENARVEVGDANTNQKMFNGISYNPSLGGPTDERPDIRTMKMELSEENSAWLKTKVSSTSKEYYITYDASPSGDPHFEFYIKTNKLNPETKSYFEFAGAVPVGLEIKGDGFLETYSHWNENFNTTRKFKIDEKGHIIELPQSIFEIGLKSKANESVKLFGKDKKDIVATVTKGEWVIVVAYEPRTDSEGELFEDRYLIETTKGIQGWILRQDVNDHEQCTYNEIGARFNSTNTTFDGICFGGD